MPTSTILVTAVFEPLGSDTRDLVSKRDLRETREWGADGTGIGHGWLYMEINL